jgi:RNA polymerase sigma-70 factor, ECF subfamily
MSELLDASDPSLIVLIAQQRQDALAEVFRRHGGAAHRLAQRVLGSGGRADEVVQDVFVGLWTAPERFDATRGSLRSFVLMRTHTKSVDVVRSESARREREQREAAAQSTVQPGYDVEREVWDIAVADRIRQALARLSDDERRAIELAYFGGRSYREVAALLGQPEGTVKSRIRIGLKALRRELGDLAVIGAPS